MAISVAGAIPDISVSGKLGGVGYNLLPASRRIKEEQDMPVKIDRSGLDKLLANAKELDGKHQVTMSDFMNPAFISAHSKFPDIDALFAPSSFKAETAEDFAAIPDDQLDDFIAKNTDFGSWAEMKESAGAEFMKAKLMKGL